MAESKIQEQVDQEAESKVPGKEDDAILRNHVLGALGVGMIPMPIVDMIALTGVQLNMLRKLAKQYDVPFSEDIAKPLLGSLIGGSLSVPFSYAFASLIKGFPLIGQTAGSMAMPVLAGATTYAVGKVFIRHFSSGGTFLTFSTEKVKEFYKEKFKEGRQVASSLKK